MHDTFSGEIGYWVSAAREWPCTCQTGGRVGAPMCLCDRCRVIASLDAAADHVAAGRLERAAAAVRRAAQIEGRLDELRDRLEEAVFDASPYESMELAVGTGPTSAGRTQDPAVLYDCGLTYAQHKAIVSDAILRGAEMDVIAPQHVPEFGIHLGQANCRGCHSTFSWALPGHREDDEDAGFGR